MEKNVKKNVCVCVSVCVCVYIYIYIYTCKIESLYSTAEISTTLQMNYMSI